jgi:hypothetical protein
MLFPSRLLRKLEDSELFAPDFPKRPRFTHAQWAASGEDANRQALSAGVDAIRRVSNATELADLVRKIGDARLDRAVPALVALWSDCAVSPVRAAAGRALRTIATADARAALIALIEDADPTWLSVTTAVSAIFEADPSHAFERLDPYFAPGRLREPGGTAIPSRVLATFSPGALRGGTEPLWSEPQAPAWFRQDPRWMDLCIRLRHNEHLGQFARDVLRYADPAQVKQALANTQQREGPRVIAWRTVAPGDLVARYRRGEHEAVWTELRAHQAISGALREEALALARETMQRVARSVDLLAQRLAAGGWKARSGALRAVPGADDVEIFASVESVTRAPLPPSLRSFWEVVGGVDFIWDYDDDDEAPDFGPGLALEQMDPLSIEPATTAPQFFEEWQDGRSSIDADLNDPCMLYLAPDWRHKADISGGEGYGIELPFLGADPVLAGEEHGLPFVDYLRLALRWGGFPRLERHAEDDAVRQFVAAMTRDLEPF